jgi:hypothetical protein
VQASASSPAVLIFKLTGGPFGDLVGAAACIGEAQTRVKPKTRMNRMEHVLRLIVPHNACPPGPFGRIGTGALHQGKQQGGASTDSGIKQEADSVV